MRKIAVLGSGGSGKSVLARKLGEITKIPVYHLDALYWKPGWTPTPYDEWRSLQTKLVKNDEWIIDGMYAKSLDIRAAAADTIIYLDFPSWLTTYRVIKRGISLYGTTRPDLAEGCPEKVSWQFIKFVWGFRKNRRPSVLAKINSLSGKNVFILKNPSEVDKFIRKVEIGSVEHTDYYSTRRS
ncbi:DNA topology modulation protein [Alicyclobacillus fastidiosus]|uniref:DNA topology modulation protein n=1 Tax=Alicyclobacillus fastidiosus TaxID=392011 RepID=A0ABY6ZER6_9BACL|nr:DNA topology modulation protein [Alicyclobacillus fastidiosus]WAH41341.1 DNA topology modulation protein [Alicyclobacillus fastidiosus]GMA62950.1 topology modulation protein [Alicyclobacillus fastidiosus]